PVTADQQGSVVGPLINSLTCADVQAVEDVTVLAGPVFKISTSKGHDQHKVSGSEVESRRPGMIACHVQCPGKPIADPGSRLCRPGVLITGVLADSRIAIHVPATGRACC